MLQTIKEEDLLLVEALEDPICFAETMFTNYDNLSFYEVGKLGHIRLGQIPLLSFEYMVADDPALKQQENFSRREGAGNSWIIGGRNFGKTLTEKIDMMQSFMLLDGYPMGITSYDAIHIRGVVEPLLSCLDTHPILKEWKQNSKRSPTYLITSKNKATIEGINMNIAQKNPGSQFFQKHLKKIWVEECSFETEEVYKKRIDSKHEAGCVERASGMTNFTKHSPAGRVFYDITKRPHVLNVPQYINPFFDEAEKEKAIKKYGGENSIGYRIFVKGEVVEEGVSVFDMERIRPFYVENRRLKKFEVPKAEFRNLENILDKIERPTNADMVYLCADIGEAAPTEIVMLTKVAETYNFLVQISLYGLTDKEQFQVFKFLIQHLEVNIVGIDTTDGTGRAIYRSLEEIFPKENLIWCNFSEKIQVGFEKDDNGRHVFKDGKPCFVEEYVSEWSVKRLKTLLYDGKVLIPEENSHDFDIQINSIVSAQSGQRVIYSCIADEDHLYQAFQVFAIAHWNTEFVNAKPINAKRFSKHGV